MRRVDCRKVEHHAGLSSPRSRLISAFETHVKGRSTFDYWGQLEVSQWLRSEELTARQLTALRNLVRHAETTCPYYRDRWAAQGLGSERLDDLRAFELWPILERGVVRSEAKALRSDAPGLKRIQKATGGSSGVPVQFELDSGIRSPA